MELVHLGTIILYGTWASNCILILICACMFVVHADAPAPLYLLVMLLNCRLYSTFVDAVAGKNVENRRQVSFDTLCSIWTVCVRA